MSKQSRPLKSKEFDTVRVRRLEVVDEAGSVRVKAEVESPGAAIIAMYGESGHIGLAAVVEAAGRSMVTLNDAAGRARVLAYADEDGATVSLADLSESVRVVATVNGDVPFVALVGSSGEVVVRVHIGADGEPYLTLAKEGSPCQALWRNEES